MATFQDFGPSIYKLQKDIVEGYVNYKRGLGEVISAASYKQAQSELFKSNADGLKPISLFMSPFMTGKKFSSYLMAEFIQRVGLNLEFLKKSIKYGHDMISAVTSKYDNVLSQVKDNYNKVAVVKAALMPAPMSCNLPLPLLLDGQTAKFIKVNRREEATNVNKLHPSYNFPMIITTSADQVLRNKNIGFKISYTNSSNSYILQIRDNGFDGHESLQYALQIEKFEETLRYRASSDGSYYGDWREIDNVEEFSPIHNDYGDYVGLDFRIVSNRSDYRFNKDWFLRRAEHVIKVVNSSDYGFIKELTLVLERPVMLSSVSLFNFGQDPFIVERVEVSLDDKSYITVAENRQVCHEATTVSVSYKAPVKFVRLILKQETFKVKYVKHFDLDGVVNVINLAHDNKNLLDLIDHYAYDISWRVLREQGLRDYIYKLLTSRNFDENYTIRKYVYTIHLDGVLINGKGNISNVIF